MAPIKNVAVIGASGNLGKLLVPPLVSAGYTVTALTRASSSATFPTGVTAKPVDFDSRESLVSAFRNQDAVISTTTILSAASARLIIDAAVEAGVGLFMPSEFGADTRRAEGTYLGQVVVVKTQTRDYLAEMAAKNKGFTWTAVATDFFIDWCLETGWTGFDIAAKKARILDSGDEKFSGTNVKEIIDTVLFTLANPDKVANRYLILTSFTTSQNEILKALEAEQGAKYDVTRETSAELTCRLEENISQGDRDLMDRLWLFYLADGAAHTTSLEKSDNALLGLEPENLEQTVKRVVAGLKK